MAENKNKETETNKSAETAERKVETGSQEDLSKDTVKQRVVQKLRAGDFTFPEDLAWGIAKALGVDKELDAAAFGRDEAPSPTAGSTPATGSGGTPITPDAAHADTKKAAKDAEKRLKDNEYDGNDSAQALRKGNDRRLAAAVNDES